MKTKRTYTHTQEAREKIRQGHLGKKPSLETCLKISKTKSGKLLGELSPNWRGGVSKESHKERTSKKYREWRLFVFQRDDYTCQDCKQHGGDLHADHKRSFRDYPELRYEVGNGRTLCRACHYYVTFKKKIPPDSKWGLLKIHF